MPGGTKESYNEIHTHCKCIVLEQYMAVHNLYKRKR